MISRYTYKNLTWLDILEPSPEEIRDVIVESGFPPVFANDLTVMVPHSESFAKSGALKMVVDWPIVHRTDINHPQEIKFLVTKTHLITIRFEEIEALQRFAKEFEVRCLLQKGRPAAPPQLLLVLLTYLYEGMYLKLDHLESRLHDVEEQIFNSHEKEMVFELSDIVRRLITFRQTMGAHENALEQLSDSMVTGFGKKYEIRNDDLNHRYRSIMRQVTALSSVAEDLRNTNMALLSTKENETMKLFTILAFITFPLTLFTSTFGMNTVYTPILGMKHDFWIIISIMFVVSVFLFAYFKYKKWL